MVYLEVDYKFCFSPQVVFRCSLLRVLRSMCAAGRRSHTFSRPFHFMLFTLARVLSCSLDVLFLMCFLRVVAFPVLFPMPVSTGIHRPAGRELGSGTCWLSDLTHHVNAVSECRRYDFPEDICNDADEEEGHCVAEQITDSTALANTPGLRAEGTWPWLRSLAAFLVGREWSDRLVRVAFVLGPFLFLLFFQVS